MAIKKVSKTIAKKVTPAKKSTSAPVKKKVLKIAILKPVIPTT